MAARMWFAVHVLTGFSDAGGASGEMIVEENVYVVECTTHAEAERLGQQLSDNSARSNVSYLHPRPTKIDSLGVRKIVTISNPDLGAEAAPRHETEITFEVLKFANREDVDAYRSGETIRATIWRDSE